MAARSKMVSLGLTQEDLDALISAANYMLEFETKTGNHPKRVRLYKLRRRFERARIELER